MSATIEEEPKDEEKTRVNMSATTVEKLKEFYKEMGTINERQEKRVNYLESKAYQLVIFYLLFQALFLTAISQASSLRCHRWWIPFMLSLLASLLGGVALIHTIIKYSRTKWQLDVNRLERDVIKRQMDMAKMSQQQKVGSWDARSDWVEDPNRERLTPDRMKWRRHHMWMGLIVLVLFAFAVLMLLACRFILCD